MRRMTIKRSTGPSCFGGKFLPVVYLFRINSFALHDYSHYGLLIQIVKSEAPTHDWMRLDLFI